MDSSPGNQLVENRPVEGVIRADSPTGTEASNTTAAAQPTQANLEAALVTAAASSAVAATSGEKLTVDQLEIDLLPVIYDIIRCVEKDPVDNNSKQRESQECSQKLLDLQRRLDSARQQVKQLRGIYFNKEEQQERLELLRNQLKLKQRLIKKYKDVQFS